MSGALAFLMRNVHDVPSPREWMLEITSRCNLACPMCLRTSVQFTPGDMDPLFIRHIFESNPHPEALWPYGYGEPLLYAHLFEIIKYAKRNDVTVSISTNGTQLSASIGRRLLQSGLDYLILAFDGATPETYRKYRKGADFDVVKNNIDRFLAMKIRHRCRIHVTVQMILMQETVREASDFRKLWNREGVNCVRVRRDLSERDCTRDVANGRRPCFFLWRGPLFVQAGGTLIPCPYYHGAEPFGDLREQTVEQAWNSPKMTALREAHVSGDLSQFPRCAKCPRYQPSALLAAASFLIGTREIRRFLPIVERVQNSLGVTWFE